MQKNWTKNVKRFSFLIAYILLCNCTSNIQLLDSWKANALRESIHNKTLIIANSPDKEVKISYEISVAEKLRKNNLEVLEFHKIFPEVKYKENRSKKEIKNIVQAIKKAGFSNILLISLKTTIQTAKENIKTTNYREEYKASSINLSDREKAIKKEDIATIKNTSTTYVIESVMYDLELLEGDQLVNVCLVDVTDPKSARQILNQFSKIVARQIKK